MVAFESEWQAYPGNITNLADVANGDPPNFRARPTYARPADHPDDAAPVILAVHKRAMDRHQAYTTASSTLNVALLASVGVDNTVSLKATYNPTPLYAEKQQKGQESKTSGMGTVWATTGNTTSR